MNIPQDLKYSKEHEWASIEGDVVTVGITDYAQDELGDVVYVELPDEGSETKRDEPFGVVESVKAASDVYAPVSGKIVEVNEVLSESPELVNEDPYGEAWMVKIRVADASELGDLMTPAEYAKYVEEEKKK